jgi:hypothetical protein
MSLTSASTRFAQLVEVRVLSDPVSRLQELQVAAAANLALRQLQIQARETSCAATAAHTTPRNNAWVTAVGNDECEYRLQLL